MKTKPVLRDELTLEEHAVLRKHPKEKWEKAFIFRLDYGQYYFFYVYPSYIKLIGKNGGVKLFHIYPYNATLLKDMQEAIRQATGLKVLQRDIEPWSGGLGDRSDQHYFY